VGLILPRGGLKKRQQLTFFVTREKAASAGLSVAIKPLRSSRIFDVGDGTC